MGNLFRDAGFDQLPTVIPIPSTLSLNINAAHYFPIPIVRNGRVTITPSMGAGWSHEQQFEPYGPEGVDTAEEIKKWLADKSENIGSLIGAFSDVAEPVLDYANWGARIGSSRAFHIGAGSKNFTAPSTGYLYLLMNDAFKYPPSDPNNGYEDNTGSISVRLDFGR